MNKFKLAITAVSLLGLAVIASSCSKTPAAAPAAGPPAMPPSPVTVHTVQPSELAGELDLIGQTGSSSKIEIRARIPGFIMTRPFKEGSYVHTGDVLFTIDPRTIQADVDIAKAQLAKDQATLEQANREVIRINSLVARGAAGSRELDDAKTAVEQTNAMIGLSKAQLAKTQLDLSYTTIVSPFDGAIGEALKHEGSYVDATNNGLLAELVRIDPIYAYFPLSERDRLTWKSMIDTGQIKLPEDKKIHVKLILADGSIYEHDGIINYSDVETNPDTGTTTLRADVPNPDHKLSPGQFLRATAIGWSHQNVMVVPQRSVSLGETGAFVYVATDGKAIPRPVVLGPWYKWGWIINKGLNPGDKVVADGIAKIFFPGAPIEVTGEVGLEPAGADADADKSHAKPADAAKDGDNAGAAKDDSKDSAKSQDKPAKE